MALSKQKLLGALGKDHLDRCYSEKYGSNSCFMPEKPIDLQVTLGADGAFDESGDWTYVSPGQAVFTALATLPMGLAWGLHFRHWALVQVALQVLQISGIDATQAAKRIVADGVCIPPLGPCRPSALCYADNLSFIVWDELAGAGSCR